MFEEVVDEDCTDTLVQNILSLEHVIDGNDKSPTIVPRKKIQLLGLFCDAHSKEYNFQHCFMGIQDHHLHVLIRRLCKQNYQYK
jgi:hypothetical protein